MHPFSRLALLLCGVLLSSSALADMDVRVSLYGREFAVQDLRPDDSFAAVAFVGGWKGDVSAVSRTYAGGIEDYRRDDREFDSVLSNTVEAAVHTNGLSVDAGFRSWEFVGASAYGLQQAFDPDPRWAGLQAGSGTADGVLTLHVGAYTSLTVEFLVLADIVNLGPSSDRLAAEYSYYLGAQQGHKYLPGSDGSGWGGADFLSYTIVNNTGRAAVYDVGVGAAASVRAVPLPPVPEPAGYTMLGAGLGALGLCRRRSRHMSGTSAGHNHRQTALTLR